MGNYFFTRYEFEFKSELEPDHSPGSKLKYNNNNTIIKTNNSIYHPLYKSTKNVLGIGLNITLNNEAKKFKSYNILDKNIVIGIWDNPNKKNIMENQGIWIGEHDKIYQLVFAMSSYDFVVLYFQDNITLKISKGINYYLLELKSKKININYNAGLSDNIINKLNKINNNSSDLDLIFNIIEK